MDIPGDGFSSGHRTGLIRQLQVCSDIHHHYRDHVSHGRSREVTAGQESNGGSRRSHGAESDIAEAPRRRGAQSGRNHRRGAGRGFAIRRRRCSANPASGARGGAGGGVTAQRATVALAAHSDGWRDQRRLPLPSSGQGRRRRARLRRGRWRLPRPKRFPHPPFSFFLDIRVAAAAAVRAAGLLVGGDGRVGGPRASGGPHGRGRRDVRVCPAAAHGWPRWIRFGRADSRRGDPGGIGAGEIGGGGTRSENPSSQGRHPST